MAAERLQKLLARAGIASRRAAEQYVLSGRVRVNGHVATELGTKADIRTDRVEVDGRRITPEAPVYLVLHKPRGVVSTMSDPEGRPSVRELLADAPARVYPVGRLDFATSGVLLATNDGDFAEGLMHPKRAVPKKYVVKVSGVMQPKDLERWRRGIQLEDGMTLPSDVDFLRHENDKTWFVLTIREGRNQQIRRMGEATGFTVMRLSRVAFAEVTSEGLRPGAWRALTRDELAAIKKAYGVPRRVPSQATASAPPRRSPTQGPRYGGGAPGRRRYDVSRDWEGGTGRGSSGGRHGNDNTSGPPGRGGRTRTTGTAGGIGATDEGDASWRVKSRRRIP